jgi:hypothetical protein
MLSDIPLPDVKNESPKYVATIVYQKPKRIMLHGRIKTSPKFDTLYGIIYWLNSQPYNMEYSIYRTDKKDIIREGTKKIGEVIK